MKKGKVLVMKAKMKNQLKNKRCFESSFPCTMMWCRTERASDLLHSMVASKDILF